MSRNPRTCAGLTKTQQLRQAKSAALVKDLDRKREEATRNQADPFSRRRVVSKYEPKKVDFTKPGLTKAMLARVKQAEKFKQEYERKHETVTSRQPKRTPAPIGGDARVGREKIPGREPPKRAPAPACRPTTLRPPSPPRRRMEPGPSRTPARRDPPPPPRTPKVQEPPAPVPKKTNELARMMNADVIQAEPIGEGPISNIVIPPGVVNDNHTTIVSIQQPGGADVEVRQTSQLANRSMQVISDTLEEQDAIETSAVQSRLAELQQARRDFVMAVANVGANAVNIEDESPPPSPPMMSPKQTSRVPEGQLIDIEYEPENPEIIAARKYMEEKQAAKRMQEEFERVAARVQEFDELNLDVPIEEEMFHDRDISWDETEDGVLVTRPSRVKAYTPAIPKQQEPYQYEPFDPEVLERFFDLQRFPPCPRCGPPPGREALNPDLWDLDDPWFRLPSGPEGPDLIEFDLIDLD